MMPQSPKEALERVGAKWTYEVTVVPEKGSGGLYWGIQRSGENQFTYQGVILGVAVDLVTNGAVCSQENRQYLLWAVQTAVLRESKTTDFNSDPKRPEPRFDREEPV